MTGVVAERDDVVPPASKAHAFEPFYTTKEPGKGTGMGLATVDGIVSQSGGTIRLESTPGVGTVFRVFLPLVDEEVAAAEAGGPPTAAERLSGSERILLAEDEPAVRAFTRRALEELGYTVLEASNGSEAMALANAQEGAIDLLVTDAVMPVMGGPALVERLAASRPSLRVLLISGYADEYRTALDGTGQVAFLAKPFSREALGRAVRTALAGPNLR